MGEFIDLTASDGHKLSAYRASPSGKPKGAIVVIQEIFGVNHHIQKVADGYAAKGYLAIAPAIFDRLERGFVTGYTPDDMTKARAAMGKIDKTKAVLDVEAARAAVASAGKVGVVGYCFGGMMSFLSACELKFDASVIYYGHAETVKKKANCPVIAHFGLQDASISQENVAEFKAANPDVPVYTYEAGHGFNCDERGSYNKVAADLALERSLAFFKEKIG